jgi:hypothetical protein
MYLLFHGVVTTGGIGVMAGSEDCVLTPPISGGTVPATNGALIAETVNEPECVNPPSLTKMEKSSSFIVERSNMPGRVTTLVIGEPLAVGSKYISVLVPKMASKYTFQLLWLPLGVEEKTGGTVP